MKPEPMNIAVSVSKYYLPYTYVMLHSLLKNNACPIDVYVLHRELCPADFDFLRTLTHTHPLVINDCRLSEDQIPLSADDNAAPAAPESLFYLSIPGFSRQICRASSIWIPTSLSMPPCPRCMQPT